MGYRSFSSLTPAGQRVRIARDVLKRLDEGTVSSLGGYFRLMVLRGAVDRDAPFRPQLKRLVGESGACSACAIGALFVSSIMLQNHSSARELGLKDQSQGWTGEQMLTASRCAIARRLRESGSFSAMQLQLIETAFEGFNITDSPRLDDDQHARVRKFYSKHAASPDRRMAAIMRNIVENRGEFIP